MTACINKILLRDPVNCSRGAPLGQRDFVESTKRLLLQRVRFVDYCYSPDGTYWGAPDDLWCAFNPEDAEYAAGFGTRIFVRAPTREGAMTKILCEYPDLTFVRGGPRA